MRRDAWSECVVGCGLEGEWGTSGSFALRELHAQFADGRGEGGWCGRGCLLHCEASRGSQSAPENSGMGGMQGIGRKSAAVTSCAHATSWNTVAPTHMKQRGRLEAIPLRRANDGAFRSSGTTRAPVPVPVPVSCRASAGRLVPDLLSQSREKLSGSHNPRSGCSSGKSSLMMVKIKHTEAIWEPCGLAFTDPNLLYEI